MKKNKLYSAEEIAVFCEQLSLILGSSIPLYEGIEALAQDAVGTKTEGALARMDQEMKNSGSLAAAAEAAGVFPGYVTGMLQVGEASGNLDTVMSGLAQHYHREAQIRAGMKDAARYPLTLIAVMALVVIVLVFQVMPVFEEAYRSLSGGLSASSASIMRIGQGAGLAVFAVMFCVLGLAAVIWLFMRSEKHRPLAERMLGRLPGYGELRRRMAGQRFASVMSMLLSSGFPLEEALEHLPDVFEGEQERAMMKSVSEQVLGGAAIADVIEQTHLFSPLHMRMIRIGFAAGQTDTALGRVAQLEAQRIDEIVARLISLIEPVLVVLLSAMIGTMLLAVMMPLAGVLSAMA